MKTSNVAPALVTLASLLVAWGSIATLLYVEPEDEVYVWTVVLLILVSAVAWWILSKPLAPSASSRQRLRMASWGVAALTAWIVVPLVIVVVLFYPLAMAGAVGAGHGSTTGARILLLILVPPATAWASWVCSRRLFQIRVPGTIK